MASYNEGYENVFDASNDNWMISSAKSSIRAKVSSSDHVTFLTRKPHGILQIAGITSEHDAIFGSII